MRISRDALLRWVDNITNGCHFFGHEEHASTLFVIEHVAAAFSQMIVDTLVDQGNDPAAIANLREAVALGLIHGANQRLYDHDIRIEDEQQTEIVYH